MTECYDRRGYSGSSVEDTRINDVGDTYIPFLTEGKCKYIGISQTNNKKPRPLREEDRSNPLYQHYFRKRRF